MQFRAVDFPQPDGPSRAMNSPARTVRLRFTSASTPPKLRPTPLSSSESNLLAAMAVAQPSSYFPEPISRSQMSNASTMSAGGSGVVLGISSIRSSYQSRPNWAMMS